MTRTIVLDSGILGKITHPRIHGEVKSWFQALLRGGAKVCVPEISDYELRRELLRAHKDAGIRRLDELESALVYLPLTTRVMRKASELWARARNLGLPTAEDAALDGDVILASQALALQETGQETVVVTDNVGHLERLVSARTWDQLEP